MAFVFCYWNKKGETAGGIILGKGFYVPKFVKINIAFNSETTEISEQGEIGNQVKLGAVSLKLNGPAKYPGKKNILAFDFTQMEFSLFSKVIYNQKIRSGKNQAEDFYQQSIGKQAFFAFFLVTENMIAARVRGGGLAIWMRDN